MTVKDEFTLIYGWLDTTLKADAALVAEAPGGFHAELADRSATYPYVLVTMTAQPRHLGMVGDLPPVWVDGVFIVKLVDKDRGIGPLTAGANRIVNILHGKRDATLAGRFWSTREGAWQRRYDIDGITYQELGAEFRIRCQVL